MIIRKRIAKRPNRRGVALLLVALLLPCFLGLFALTVDAGRALETHRRIQSAADVAALGIVHRLARGYTRTEALTHAQTLRQSIAPMSQTLIWGTGVAGTFDVVNNPPSSGPHAGNAAFYEVIVTSQVPGLFSGALGWAESSRVVARAVAGLETDLPPEGLAALNPCAVPGLSLGGNSAIRVEGSVVINSGGAGQDQNGFNVNLGMSQYAVDVGNNSTVTADLMMVRGGVNSSRNILPLTTGAPQPLQANIRQPWVDPYASLPIPKPSNTPSITNWTTKQSADVKNKDNVTLNPGIYSDISVATGGTLKLNPGVYVISPTKSGDGLNIANGGTLTANGVMLYLTRSNYLDRSPGYWDTLDGAVNSLVTTPTGTNCALPAAPDGSSSSLPYASLEMDVNQGFVTMSGLNDPSSPFNKFVIFQRRRSTNTLELDIKAGASNIKGLIYAKWAEMELGNNADLTMEAQLIVGSLKLGGGAKLNLIKLEKSFYLVSETALFE